jgi:tetratricopeptide (TPR) repeat protein
MRLRLVERIVGHQEVAMRFVPAGLVAVLLMCPVSGVAADPPAEPKAPTIEELIADLGNPTFSLREKAQRLLRERGREAIPALEKALKGDDPEVAKRARELLHEFAWGALPDTPAEVRKLILEFRNGDPNPERNDEVRKRAIAELLKRGRPGVAAVRSILQRNIPPESRAPLIATVTTQVRHEVPLLLLAGKTAEADELIALHAVGTTTSGAADFAAYHTLRGDLPAAITRAEAAFAAGPKTDDARLMLVYLYRAAGMWGKARDVADDLTARENAPNYREILLEDEGNWSALADLTPGREFNHPEAVRLTLMRRAGRADKLDAAAKQLRADAEEYSAPNDILSATVALLSNHRADAATDLLLEKKKNLALLSEILVARMRYREALDLIGAGKVEKEAIGPDERRDFNLRRARVLMLTGHTDEAVQLFTSVASALVNTDQKRVLAFTQPARALVRTELRLGLRDLACEHAAPFADAMREGNFPGAQGESPYELLFPNDPVAAETLFVVLRENRVPGDEPGPTMLRVRELLGGSAGKAAVDQAVVLLRESAAGFPPGPANLLKARRYFALAQVCRAAQRGEVAEGAFKVAAELTAGATDAADARGARSWVYGAPDPARVWIEWGEFLTASGRYRDAATVFEAGWKLYPDQPLPLYLCGKALMKAGDTREGERRIDLAHWVSLGNEKLRGRFLDELVRRGEAKAIRREVALILRACWSQDHFFGNVMNQCARGSALVGDFATAETCAQRSLLVVLRNVGVYFVDPAGYFNVPQDMLVFHARAQLRADKLDEALAAARSVLAVTPGHLDLVNGIVPELDQRGKKKEADELFEGAWRAYQKVLADYPNSPSAWHALASLAGHCRRNLDDGLKYARAAVAADPGSPAYREALAEVYFRRGAREDAVKIMQKLADEQPRHALYQRQLARYRTGTLDSPWPHTTE